MNVKSKYSGTQTEKNLSEAFTGNLQVRNRYTYCSSVAKSKGSNRFPISFSKRPTVKGSKKEMSFDNRMRCLQDLRITGFQTCGGFMVSRPHQTPQVFVNSKTAEVRELLLQSRCENEK